MERKRIPALMECAWPRQFLVITCHTSPLAGVSVVGDLLTRIVARVAIPVLLYGDRPFYAFPVSL